MSSASQGPGWWQASDGNWYPPQQQSGYQAPPPPAGYPPSPQNPAPGAPAFGNAQAAFGAAVAHVPVAAWLLFGGFVVAILSLFMPAVTANFLGQSISISLWAAGGEVYVIFLLLLAAAAVSVTLFVRPPTHQRALIGLSAAVGLLAVDLIYNWFTYDTQIAGTKGDTPHDLGFSISPGFGLILYTVAIAFVTWRIVMDWLAQSKARPQAY